MITDPDDRDYRFPQPGERLWHEPQQAWIRITGDTPYGHVCDEVAGVFEDSSQSVVVKLRSLRSAR